MPTQKSAHVFIHNCLNLETAKMSFSRGVDKYTVVYLVNGVLFSAKKK